MQEEQKSVADLTNTILMQLNLVLHRVFSAVYSSACDVKHEREAAQQTIHWGSNYMKGQARINQKNNKDRAN